MKNVIYILFLLLTVPLYAQQIKDPGPGAAAEGLWTSFWEEESELIGFKDSKGNIMISPKFEGGGTIAQKFHSIIAVTEPIHEQTYHSYYLLKDGKQVGLDSVFFWDNTPDCESEEKIRFHDRKTDKLGFFNKYGEVVIPAVYNYALPFRSGLTVAMKGAEKICGDGTSYAANNRCEHWRWTGGHTLLINEQNEVLIRDFPFSRPLDLSTLKITEEPFQHPSREFFEGTNGKLYSFINLKKEFQHWFNTAFLNPDSLMEASFKEITFWSKTEQDRVSVSKGMFLAQNKAALIKKIKQFKKDELDYFVSMDGLNRFIFDKEIYAPYFDYCGNAKEWKYPVMVVVVSYEQEDYQDHISFLKSAEGYKLLHLNLNSDILR